MVKKIRIAIADDHTILRAGLKSLLSAQPDIEVVEEAKDAADALARCERAQPDVLILDLSMPGGGGLETLRGLRRRCPNTRVLVLTMYSDKQTLKLVFESGVDGFLVKTAADTELLTALRAVAAGRAYVDASMGGHLLREVLLEREDRRAPDPNVLSEREQQVLVGVAMGHTHKEIAASLSVSVKTVETYRQRLAEKLSLRSRADLVRYAWSRGLLPFPKLPDSGL